MVTISQSTPANIRLYKSKPIILLLLCPPPPPTPRPSMTLGRPSSTQEINNHHCLLFHKGGLSHSDTIGWRLHTQIKLSQYNTTGLQYIIRMFSCYWICFDRSADLFWLAGPCGAVLGYKGGVHNTLSTLIHIKWDERNIIKAAWATHLCGISFQISWIIRGKVRSSHFWTTLHPCSTLVSRRAQTDLCALESVLFTTTLARL